MEPQPVLVPELATFKVTLSPIDARIQLNRISDASRKPVDLTFVNGHDNRETLLRLMIPVARSDQREGEAPALNGSLEDWTAADCIQNGRLVRMLSRPAMHRQELQFAQTNTQVFSSWTLKDLYLAFRVEGIEQPKPGAARSLVENFQFRRAWGEDLAEVLIQPIYADNTAGPVVHIICRPGGQVQVARKLNPKLHAEPLQPVAGADVRYAATVAPPPSAEGAAPSTTGQIWRGEVAIPWALLGDPNRKDLPALLRFNFVQHRHAVGESASWAGPVDYGRDESFMGLLDVRALDRIRP